MEDAARRFALANPQLASVDIAYVRPGSCCASPDWEAEEEVQQHGERTRTGRFAIEHDARGSPVRMRGIETAAVPPASRTTTSETWLAPSPPSSSSSSAATTTALAVPNSPSVRKEDGHLLSTEAVLGAVFASKAVDTSVVDVPVLKAAAAEFGRLRLPVLSALLLVVTICGSVAFE
jgi:hypothetical protein